jgi:hypothetical protein
MSNKIIWEKWTDPFGDNFEETKWNHYDDENLDEEAEFLENDLLKNRLAKPVKVIASPLGLIPYNEYTASSKIFNFWIGHTNFNITKNISDTIERCEGVELLDIFTRYRFRIGIGKCFSDSDTMSNITEKINGIIDDRQTPPSTQI